jgi:hypothetical protein
MYLYRLKIIKGYYNKKTCKTITMETVKNFEIIFNRLDVAGIRNQVEHLPKNKIIILVLFCMWRITKYETEVL